MTKKTIYTNESLGKVEVIPDFFPSPAELAWSEECVKVTLALSKSSVDFFKLEASKHQTQYQRMIRRLLDSYVEAHVPPAKTDRLTTGTPKRMTPKRVAS